MSGLRRMERQLCDAVRASLRRERANPPEAGVMLWNLFHRLSNLRTYHAAGPNPIQPGEVVAYCVLMRLPLEPHHARILFAMDAAWLDQAHALARAAPDGVKALPPISKRPISAALLDAVLG